MGRLLLALIAFTAIAAPLAGPLSGTASATWYDNGVKTEEPPHVQSAAIEATIELGSPAVPAVRCRVLADLEYAGTQAEITGLHSTFCTEPNKGFELGSNGFDLLGKTTLSDEGPRSEGQRGVTTLPWPVTLQSLEPPKVTLGINNMTLFLVTPEWAQRETRVSGTLEVQLFNGIGNGLTPTTFSQGQYFVGGMDFKEVHGALSGWRNNELIQWK
jgi:hypothetical protein